MSHLSLGNEASISYTQSRPNCCFYREGKILLNTLYERTAITIWRKRLQSVLALLVRLFLTLLAGLKHRQPFNTATVAGRILLVDLSRFKRRKTDDDWLLHS